MGAEGVGECSRGVSGTKLRTSFLASGIDAAGHNRRLRLGSLSVEFATGPLEGVDARLLACITVA
jgi:hypothetical protein